MLRIKSFHVWALQLVPPFLRGEWGEKLVSTMGLTFSMLTESVILAGEAAMMDSPNFAPDALQRIGKERKIRRYYLDTDATYKARLKNAWQAWAQAGTRQGMLAQLEAMGLQATIYENHEWNWDGDAANWSRFWVVITGHPWAQVRWGEKNYGDESFTYGSTMHYREVLALRQLVRQWKPGHVVCSHIIIVFDQAAWAAALPNGTWGVPEQRNTAAAAFIPG